MGDLIAYVFMCMISWMIRLPCEITDQLAVGTQNCFSTLFYTPYILTLKQTPRMHQNAQLPDKKILKKSGEGARPSPQTIPSLGRGYPLPRPHLDSTRRSRSFSFTTQHCCHGANQTPSLHVCAALVFSTPRELNWQC